MSIHGSTLDNGPPQDSMRSIEGEAEIDEKYGVGQMSAEYRIERG